LGDGGFSSFWGPLELQNPAEVLRIAKGMVLRRKLPEGIIEQMQDRRGRMVNLPEKSMRHIARRHPEMDGCQMAIKAAVESARDRCHGKKNGEPIDGREILYAQQLGPAAWLAVVVAYVGDMGTVITAFADRNGPREAARI
jgi:hypothetical protein